MRVSYDRIPKKKIKVRIVGLTRDHSTINHFYLILLFHNLKTMIIGNLIIISDKLVYLLINE